MIDFLYSDTIFLRVLFYVLVIFLGWFEAKIYTSDKKIGESKRKYYIVSLSSFIISGILLYTGINAFLYRFIAITIIYGVFRYKIENPIVVAVSLVMIQIYEFMISLLLFTLLYLVYITFIL